jgi:AcrR family transcriptional regulator
MKKSGTPSPTRPYHQTARAQAAEATAREIVKAFADCMQDRWFDEVTLEEVAKRAGVTMRTVIRRFGGKEGLIEAFVASFEGEVAALRHTAPGDIAAAIARVLDLYEEWGDSVIRNLAQEPRYPALKPLLDLGRREHRALTAVAFAPWLNRLSEAAQQPVLDALVVATDVYTWKLLRRDMARSRKDTEAVLRRLVDAVLAQAFASAPPGG